MKKVKKITSPGRAIRAKCIDCSNNSAEEVKCCPVKDCPLWAFRFGKNPFRTVRVLTDEQKAEAAERFRKVREAKNNGQR